MDHKVTQLPHSPRQSLDPILHCCGVLLESDHLSEAVLDLSVLISHLLYPVLGIVDHETKSAKQYRGCFKRRLSHFSKLAESLQNEKGVVR